RQKVVHRLERNGLRETQAPGWHASLHRLRRVLLPHPPTPAEHSRSASAEPAALWEHLEPTGLQSAGGSTIRAPAASWQCWRTRSATVSPRASPATEDRTHSRSAFGRCHRLPKSGECVLC